MREADRTQGDRTTFDALNGPSGFQADRGHLRNMPQDFKMQLDVELAPYSCGKIIYESHDSVGPGGTKGIRCTLKVSGRRIGQGFGETKEESEQRAAEDGLKALHAGTVKFKPKK